MGEAKRSVSCIPRDFLAAWGRGDAGPVPCGACTACCHYPAVVVDEKRDRKRLARLLTERSPDGELVLQRRSDGACVHLGKQGCTVYEQRPAVCRTFDCRVFAAMGLVERCGPNYRTPQLGVRRELAKGRASPTLFSALPLLRRSPSRLGRSNIHDLYATGRPSSLASSR
jgi:Putative zinc- or iron-chelating domain